jgi:hypothetical protein
MVAISRTNHHRHHQQYDYHHQYEYHQQYDYHHHAGRSVFGTLPGD